MDNKKIPVRVSAGIINSLAAGVVPRVGLEYMAVGRKDEIFALTDILDEVKLGASTFKIICGRYGSGKSFFLQMIRSYALQRGFVVADVDMSPDKLLCGTKGQGLNTYRELLARISTQTLPDAGALELILQKWVNQIRLGAAADGYEGESLNAYVKQEIFRTIDKMKESAHGFSFATAMSAYWEGYIHDEGLKSSALQWLRGEFNTKTDAKKVLPVDEIINDDNWYDYIKLLCRFLKNIGYSGFLIFLDESINLYKIPNKITREKNYEKLLSFFNDTIQGRVESFGIVLAAIPQVLHDERRGLYSYEAFRSRLVQPSVKMNGFVDSSAPVIYLNPLSHEEILILLEKVLQIYQSRCADVTLTNDDIIYFLEGKLSKVGAETLMTPREILRDFIAILNVRKQCPETNIQELMNCALKETETDDDVNSDNVVIEF